MPMAASWRGGPLFRSSGRSWEFARPAGRIERKRKGGVSARPSSVDVARGHCPPVPPPSCPPSPQLPALNATVALQKLAVLKPNVSMLGAKPRVTTAMATLAAMKNITIGATLTVLPAAPTSGGPPTGTLTCWVTSDGLVAGISSANGEQRRASERAWGWWVGTRVRPRVALRLVLLPRCSPLRTLFVPHPPLPARQLRVRHVGRVVRPHPRGRRLHLRTQDRGRQDRPAVRGSARVFGHAAWRRHGRDLRVRQRWGTGRAFVQTRRSLGRVQHGDGVRRRRLRAPSAGPDDQDAQPRRAARAGGARPRRCGRAGAHPPAQRRAAGWHAERRPVGGGRGSQRGRGADGDSGTSAGCVHNNGDDVAHGHLPVCRARYADRGCCRRWRRRWRNERQPGRPGRCWRWRRVERGGGAWRRHSDSAGG